MKEPESWGSSPAALAWAARGGPHWEECPQSVRKQAAVILELYPPAPPSPQRVTCLSTVGVSAGEPKEASPHVWVLERAAEYFQLNRKSLLKSTIPGTTGKRNSSQGVKKAEAVGGGQGEPRPGGGGAGSRGGALSSWGHHGVCTYTQNCYKVIRKYPSTKDTGVQWDTVCSLQSHHEGAL